METSVHCFFNVAVDGSNQIERQLLNFFFETESELFWPHESVLLFAILFKEYRLGEQTTDIELNYHLNRP